jgi:hypothetical protein
MSRIAIKEESDAAFPTITTATAGRRESIFQLHAELVEL